MPDELLSDRVERLEKTVEGLQTLPADVAALGERVGALSEDVAALNGRVGSVETQILQLRAEVHSEFSDVRAEMRIEFAAVRSDLQTGLASVKTELRQEMQKVLPPPGMTCWLAWRTSRRRFERPQKRGNAIRECCSKKPSGESPLLASTATRRPAAKRRHLGVSGSR